MTKHERAHKTWLAHQGCAVCMRIFPAHEPGPVQLHHFRGGGWGKGGYMTLIPLCPEHHTGITGIHGMGTKAFDFYYSKHHGLTQSNLLQDVLIMKGEA